MQNTLVWWSFYFTFHFTVMKALKANESAEIPQLDENDQNQQRNQKGNHFTVLIKNEFFTNAVFVNILSYNKYFQYFADDHYLQ